MENYHLSTRRQATIFTFDLKLLLISLLFFIKTMASKTLLTLAHKNLNTIDETSLLRQFSNYVSASGDNTKGQNHH